MSSIDIFNESAMVAERTEGVSFSFPDYTVSSKSRTVYLVLDGLQINTTFPQGGSPVPGPTTDQMAWATDYNFDPAPMHTQWCYPTVDGTFHQGHPTLSTSSDPSPSSLSFDPAFSWDGSMSSFEFGGLETPRWSASGLSVPSESGPSDMMGVG